MPGILWLTFDNFIKVIDQINSIKKKNQDFLKQIERANLLKINTLAN